MHCQWAMALLFQALRLCKWPANANTLVSRAPLYPFGEVRPRPLHTAFELALAVGVHARKLWHLHLDACLGPGGSGTARVRKDGGQLLLRDGVLAVHFSHWAYACVHGMVCAAVS